MRKSSLQFVSIVSALLIASFASAAPPIVGGEKAGTVTTTAPVPTTAQATMAGGNLTIALSGVVGTDGKATVITSNPVPDGSVVCMKANGRQSADWKGGRTLGKIILNADVCTWGYGTVKGGQVTMTVAACPAGRTEAAAIMSGVVALPDGKQAWVPHPAPYRVFSSKGVDAMAIAYDCASNTASPLAADHAKVMAKLF